MDDCEPRWTYREINPSWRSNYVGKNGMLIPGSKRTRERQRAWQMMLCPPRPFSRR